MPKRSFTLEFNFRFRLHCRSSRLCRRIYRLQSFQRIHQLRPSLRFPLIRSHRQIHRLIRQRQKLTSKAVILATGSKPKHLGVPGEEKLFGAGVSYCSTCDGMFFKGKDVVVIGGGNSALHGAEYLERICKSVTLIHRRNEFRGDLILVQRMKNDSHVKFLLSHNVYEIVGEKGGRT